MSSPSRTKLAVLIDAENAQAAVLAELMSETSRYGTATIKRAYGDWTKPSLAPWKERLHPHAIQPVIQLSYTSGKNASDSALIIDAMDILHGGRVDGFCLVSSDSDFTRLATRIREAGLMAYGFGEQKTPEAFVAACDKFVFTEILREQIKETAKAPLSKKSLRPALTTAISSAAREDRWAPLSAVGSLLVQADPSFDPRNFGFAKLGELVRAKSYLESKESSAHPDSPNTHIFVRLREP